MKRIVLTLIALLALMDQGFAQQAFGPDGPEWVWQDIGKGAQAGYAQVELFGATQSISAIRFKAARHKVDIVNDPAEMADSTSALAIRHGALGAVNGSYFDVSRLTPATFVKDDGVQEGLTAAAEAYRTDGVVGIRRHHVDIVPCDTSSYGNISKRYREALASGPVLLTGGKPARQAWPKDSFFTARHPRTLVGTTADGWVYLVVIDGRAPGQAAGATIPETVQVAALLGLEDAINLDGGGSSALWSERLGVISHPCDNRKFDHSGQRKVPNAVIFR